MPARSTALMCTNTSLLPSLGWMNPKPFCVLKNFTVPVAIMASLDCNAFVSDHASIAWPVIQFWGSWLGTVKRERREADRKLVAGSYLCDRGRNVNGVVDAPDAESDCRDMLCTASGGAVPLKLARAFASHPEELRLPHARLCAAQLSPPFSFVFPRCVRVPPSVARPGLDGNSA